MCGPTDQEKNLQSSSEGFSETLKANYGQQFTEQQQALGALNNTLQEIRTGNTGTGFSPEELAAKNTQILNSGAAANANARRAAQNFGAGQGSSSGLTSGIMKQIQGSIASSSANQIAGAQENLTEQNYNQGRINADKTAAGLSALAQGYNPNASMSGAINENSESFGQAKTILEQQQQKDKTIASAIASGATAGLTFGAGGLAGLADSPAGASQPGAFFSGGLSALAGG